LIDPATYTPEDLISDLASDIQLADHAYQLAIGSGDAEKIKGAKRFLSICEKEYHLAKKEWFKKNH